MTGIEALLRTTARLRAPDGCPWDREQTHRTICDCLVEEVCELLQAIDRADDANLREELGDLLFHVVLHAQMASEAGKFDFDTVAREVNDKMVRRHPHVFGDGVRLADSESVVRQWEQIKLKEKGPAAASLFKELPPALNSVLRAREVWKQVRKKSLNPGGAVDVTAVESRAGRLDEASAGRELFELIAACKEAGLDPDSALRRHTDAVVRACETSR
jgi:XTP/dITP diphosphohydrolase/tetrapyrrole methylase family protein/MazG family protein